MKVNYHAKGLPSDRLRNLHMHICGYNSCPKVRQALPLSMHTGYPEHLSGTIGLYHIAGQEE